jgi:tripartite-type tricarboxylate transporter receptor subunit TctC
VGENLRRLTHLFGGNHRFFLLDIDVAIRYKHTQRIPRDAGLQKPSNVRGGSNDQLHARQKQQVCEPQSRVVRGSRNHRCERNARRTDGAGRVSRQADSHPRAGRARRRHGHHRATIRRVHVEGYTLAISSTGYVSAPYLFTTIPYDPEKSFEPVSQLVTYYNVLVASPKFPGKSLADYLARARQPGVVSLGSGNIGGQAWIMTAKLNKMADININYIAYKGSGPALVDAMGSHIDSVFSDPASLKGLVQEGKLHALAVTSPKRSRQFPDAPAIGELVPGYEQEGWIGLFAPAGTPKSVLATLHRAVQSVTSDPDARSKLTDGGFGIVGSSPDEFAKFIKGELASYGKIIKDANVKLSTF